MVTIIGYQERLNKEAKPFITLQLQGDLTMVKSSEGRYYATCKRTSITSTFDEVTAKALVGKQIPGRIVKVECGEYDYVVPETGELIKLQHRYEYVPEEAPTSVIPMHVVREGEAA